MSVPQTEPLPPRANVSVPDPAAVYVMHSHHYHAPLLRALYEAEGIDAGALLRQALDAAGTAIGSACLPTPQTIGDALEGLFRRCGLGRLDATGLSTSGEGTAILRGSHFAAAWRGRYPVARRPICATSGAILSQVLSETHDRPLEASETRCAAQGADACSFRVVAARGSGAVSRKRNPAVAPARLEHATSAVHCSDSDLPRPSWMEGSDGGLLGAAAGPFARLPAAFYAAATHLFEEEVPRARGAKFGNLPAILLMEAAHRNGFHLFGEVLACGVWVQEVEPTLGSEGDRVEALIGLAEGLGWGSWAVHSFLAGERLIVQIADSYEAVAHAHLFGLSESPRCHVARGAAAALMNLLFRQAKTEAEVLSPSHYNALFRSPRSFRAVETHCAAQGDPCCELVVNPLTV